MFEAPIVVVDTPRERIVLDRIGSARYPFDVLAAESLAYYWRLDEEDATAATAIALHEDSNLPLLGASYYGLSGTPDTFNVARVMAASAGPLLLGGDHRRHPWIDAGSGSGMGGVVIGNGAAKTGVAWGVWVKPDDLGSAARRRVVSGNWTYGEDTAGSKAGWWIELDASDQWVFKYAKTGVADTGPGYAWSTFTGPEATGEWQFLVVRWKANDIGAEFEVDGEVVGTDATATISPGGALGLGASWATDTTPFPYADRFVGHFAELEVHNADGSGNLAGVLDSAQRLARAAGTAANDDGLRVYPLKALDDAPRSGTNDDEPGRDLTRVGDKYVRGRILTYSGMLDADTWPPKNVERQRIRGAANALLREDGRVRWRPEGFGVDACEMAVRQHEAPMLPAEASATNVLLSFIAGDPRVFDAAQSSYYDDGTSVVGTFEVENDGDWPTPPRFLVYGPLDDLELVNHTTGERLDLTASGGLSIAASHFVEIDFAPPDPFVFYDGDPTDSRYVNVDSATSEFWELAPGVNEIEVIGTGATSGTRLFMYWRRAWLP